MKYEEDDKSSGQKKFVVGPVVTWLMSGRHADPGSDMGATKPAVR